MYIISIYLYIYVYIDYTPLQQLLSAIWAETAFSLMFSYRSPIAETIMQKPTDNQEHFECFGTLSQE